MAIRKGLDEYMAWEGAEAELDIFTVLQHHSGIHGFSVLLHIRRLIEQINTNSLV